MKPNYETIVILDANQEEAVIDQRIQKIETVIKENEGEILKSEKWGKRKLAYEIKKKNEGFYIYLSFKAGPNVVEQLKGLFKYDEYILKSISVKLEEVHRSRYGRKKKKMKEMAKETTPTVSPAAQEDTING